jgi:hypothetical protein
MRLTGYLEPMRLLKSRRIIGSFARGAGGRAIPTGCLDLDAKDHAFCGQLWTAERLLPDCIRLGLPYWHLDNGWVRPGRGDAEGFYRVTRNGMTPAFIRRADPARAVAIGARLTPWRARGRHILLALPGEAFGKPWGLRMAPWAQDIHTRVRAVTDRPIRVRPKDTRRPLAADLAEAWCVVTHSSNVAVDAVLAGIPAIVEPTSPTAPLGNVGLEWIEQPHLSDLRGEWLASLMWQQFTPQEMRDGLAWEALGRLLPSRAPEALASRQEALGPA